MNVDKWFEEQTLVVKIILIILPFVGWIMEVLIRISAFVRKQNTLDLVLLILFLLLGWTWIPLILDVIYLATKGHLFMASDAEELVNKDNPKPNEEPKKDEDIDPKKNEEQ